MLGLVNTTLLICLGVAQASAIRGVQTKYDESYA
jgi:hypothetical protein